MDRRFGTYINGINGGFVMLLEGKPVAEKIKKDIMTAVRGAKKMQG